jgi:hypothetical protein
MSLPMPLPLARATVGSTYNAAHHSTNTARNHTSIPSLADAFAAAALPSAPRLSREFGYGWNQSLDENDLDNEIKSFTTATSSLNNSRLRRRIRSCETLHSGQHSMPPISHELNLNKFMSNKWRSVTSSGHESQHSKNVSTDLARDEHPEFKRYSAPSKQESTDNSFYHSSIPFTYPFLSSTTPTSPHKSHSQSAPLMASLDRTSSDPSSQKPDVIPMNRKMAVRLDILLNAAVVSIRPHDRE